MKQKLFVLLGVSAFATLLTATAIVGCSGGSSAAPTATTSGTISVHLIDPPTCAAPNGSFSHVWITVTRVQAHISSDAGPNDSGWVDLVDLRSGPKQLDLFSLASTSCVLNQLGSTTGLPPGKYQQIRFYLLPNTPSGNTAQPATNQCANAGAFNCVVLASDGSMQPLTLSSEAKTGIKIPSGSLAGGGIQISAGQAADITIDFSACESIIQEGNGTYRLKPTLHAGEVALQQNSISGRVIDSASKKPVANAIVALEQPDANGVDRIVRSALSASDGTFFFCPLPAGPYDIVVDAASINATYIATLTTGVALGTNMGDLPITPQVGNSAASQPGTITGLATTGGSGNSAPSADVVLSALQAGSPKLQFTVPLLPGTASIITTAAGATCPASTDCASYALVVPASNPVVGAFSASGTTYAAPASGIVNYSVDAAAFMADGSNLTDCSPSEIVVQQDFANVLLAVLPGAITPAKTVAFAGCQ